MLPDIEQLIPLVSLPTIKQLLSKKRSVLSMEQELSTYDSNLSLFIRAQVIKSKVQPSDREAMAAVALQTALLIYTQATINQLEPLCTSLAINDTSVA
jgi:hypothetical protein